MFQQRTMLRRIRMPELNTGFLPPRAKRRRGEMSASGLARVADRGGSIIRVIFAVIVAGGEIAADALGLEDGFDLQGLGDLWNRDPRLGANQLECLVGARVTAATRPRGGLGAPSASSSPSLDFRVASSRSRWSPWQSRRRTARSR